jgi:hypothetical protein
MYANTETYGDIMQSIVQTIHGGKVLTGGARIIYYSIPAQTQRTSQVKLFTAKDNTVYDITFQVARHLQLESDFLDKGYTITLETSDHVEREIYETIVKKLEAAFANKFILEHI